MDNCEHGSNIEELLTMNAIKFLSLTLATCAVLSPSGVSAQDTNPVVPPGQSAPATNIVQEGLETLNGVVVLGSYEQFNLEGVTSNAENAVVVNGPDFLKQHEGRVKALLKPYLGKPLSTNDLHSMQRDLILLCRSLDRPWVDVYFPQQEIKNHIAQIMVYEGLVGKISVVYLGKKWFSERFITNGIHLRPGDSISQKKLIADVNRMTAADPQFLEVNLDVKQGPFIENEQGTAKTDIDVLIKDRFPLRVFGGYDDYGVKALGENRVFVGLNEGSVWGIAHQFNYQYTTDLNFDHLRSHTASYVAPFAWGHSLTIYGGYSDLNANLSEIASSSLLRSTGKAYQISARYIMPLPQWGKLDQVLAIGYDFKYANTPLLFNQVALNSFRAAVDQFVVNYHTRLPDAIGYSDLSASGFYSPGDMLGPNTTADFASLATNKSDLKANYYYGHVTGERGFGLPWGSLLRLEGGYQASSGRLLPSEQMYLGGDQLLRGYPEDVVAGDNGWNGTVELHTPIIRTSNITRQENIPGIRGDTLEFFGFYDYGAVRPSGSSEGTLSYYLESAGAGLNLHVSQYLAVNFAYGFELKNLPVQQGAVSASLAKDRSRALVSATLSF
jgi:hemolysin activation/secretion protein